MERLHRLLHGMLWPAKLPDSRLGTTALVVARYLYALVRDMAAGELSLRAMSLVYTTILAIVPLFAFSFALLKGLGFHREMEPLLQRFLAPVGPQATEITDNVISFVDNVSGSVLASASIALGLYTALSMARKVEGSFNFVWRVDRPRSFARRFSEYLTVMLLGPIVMSVTMGLIATLSSATLMENLRQVEPIGSLIVGVGELTPYLLVIGAFSFLYIFVPNSKVRIRSALVGGLFAGAVWAASGKLFAGIVVTAGRMQAIYSGFAIVIVVMIWLYLSWLILLLGAQLAFYLQNPDDLRLGQRSETMSNGLRERLALSTMLLVGRDFDAPAHGWRTESLAAHLRIPRHQLEPVMAALIGAGLLTTTVEQRLIPARDLHRIGIADILAAVRKPPPDTLADEGDDWNVTVRSLSDRIEGAIDSALGDQSLADLVDSDLAAAPTASAVGEQPKPIGPQS